MLVKVISDNNGYVEINSEDSEYAAKYVINRYSGTFVKSGFNIDLLESDVLTDINKKAIKIARRVR